MVSQTYTALTKRTTLCRLLGWVLYDLSFQYPRFAILQADKVGIRKLQFSNDTINFRTLHVMEAGEQRRVHVMEAGEQRRVTKFGREVLLSFPSQSF